jgi:hypothetical protein
VGIDESEDHRAVKAAFDDPFLHLRDVWQQIVRNDRIRRQRLRALDARDQRILLARRSAGELLTTTTTILLKLSAVAVGSFHVVVSLVDSHPIRQSTQTAARVRDICC